MDKLNLDSHISGQFNTELDNVRSRVLNMGGLVEKQLADLIKAIKNHDGELAEKIIENDKLINELDMQIDEECIQIIAKRQPAASDLRLIMVVLKTIADLERMGDSVASIARAINDKMESRYDSLVDSMESMAKQVQQMLHDVLDAFARMDTEAALAVHKTDKHVDRKFESAFRQMTTYMIEDPRSIPVVLAVMQGIRSLERIGDRCQNISEYIIYFVKGKDVRHMNPKELAKTVKG